MTSRHGHSPSRRLVSIVLFAALGLVIVACVAFSTVAGSLARWNASETGTGKLQLGVLSFQIKETVNGKVLVSEMNDEPAPELKITGFDARSSKMLPGDIVATSVTVQNTGTVPLSVRVTDAVFSAPFKVAFAPEGGDGCSAETFSLKDFRSHNGPIALDSSIPPLASALPSGKEQPVCVAIMLSESSANTDQGKSERLQLTLRADQIRPS
ncbi:hypothetical protein [Leifsonia poae]|uniref:hypothetical protein n=1 Tax=Leifsonia poae TaxID=110933 RepID=UPI001CBCA613|nr:hypothetical protein [Leifsonia poae]